MKRLIFGCGYLGLRVAKLWQSQGDEVICVTRSHSRAAELRGDGLGALVADVTDPATLTDLPACHTVLFAVGYDRTQSLPIDAVYVQGLNHVLRALPANIDQLIYISSTGVYGDADGDWVDETTPCRPIRRGGKACLAAEQSLLADQRAMQKIVLRLAGIYGPGRIPRGGDVQAQKPIPGLPDGYLNLIHVDDAAAIVVLAAALPPGSWNQRPLLNVTDGQPLLRRDYHQFLADWFAAPSPVFAPPDPHSTSQRGGSNKRVSNQRLMEILNPPLRYADFRKGLRQALSLETESQ